jgi:hypothetical protein
VATLVRITGSASTGTRWRCMAGTTSRRYSLYRLQAPTKLFFLFELV